jgi:hypothetical protein
LDKKGNIEQNEIINNKPNLLKFVELIDRMETKQPSTIENFRLYFNVSKDSEIIFNNKNMININNNNINNKNNKNNKNNNNNNKNNKNIYLSIYLSIYLFFV